MTALALQPQSPPNVILAQTDDTVLTVHLILPLQPTAAGLPHYAEHLTWLSAIGATNRTADRHSNAWTNAYAIGYRLSGKSADLPELIETLSGVFDPIDLPETFADEERGIVRREYELRLANNVDGQAATAIDAFLYEGNAIATSVIGTPAEIAALNYEAARVFHAETHRPEKATFIVVGDATQRQVNQALRDLDLVMSQGEYAVITPLAFDLAPVADNAAQFPDASAAPRLVFRKVVTLDAPVPYDLLEAQTVLLSDILETSLPGGLAQPLRFDAAIARSFKIGVWPIDEDHIEIGFWASPDRDVSLTQLKNTFEATLSEIAEAGIPDDTYKRVVNRFGDFWPDWGDTEEIADWTAEYVLKRVSIMRVPLSKQEVAMLEARLSLETTNALLRKLTGEGRTGVAFIGPQEIFE
ncbi:MAG: hypothetical protein ABJL99_17025 [Aliishimia sp.]